MWNKFNFHQMFAFKVGNIWHRWNFCSTSCCHSCINAKLCKRENFKQVGVALAEKSGSFVRTSRAVRIWYDHLYFFTSAVAACWPVPAFLRSGVFLVWDDFAAWARIVSVGMRLRAYSPPSNVVFLPGARKQPRPRQNVRDSRTPAGRWGPRRPARKCKCSERIQGWLSLL